MLRAQQQTDHRTPFWPNWFANEAHACLVREPVRLARITFYTRANNIFPGRLAAVVTRDDMVEIQLLARESLSAVLTLVLVALENVIARELQFLARQLVEKRQQNHPR